MVESIKHVKIMKKKIFLSLSLVASLILSSACTNDDIKIEKLLPKHAVTYNVSTQRMYDTFGQTSYVRENYLREDTLCIGITTFVYDSKGNYVDSKLTTIKNFNSTPQTFDNLLEGQYTFVTIETMVNPINNNKSSCWRFDDIESLTTLKITQTRKPSRVNILGVCYETVSVTNDVSVNVTPEAIGSFINFHCYNWENSKYLNLGFATQDILKYYSLDPKLSRKDRFNRDLTASNYFNVRGTLRKESAGQGYYLPIYILESDIDWSNAGQKESNINTSTWTPWATYSATLEDGKVYENGFYFLYSENDNSYADSYFGDEQGLNSWKKVWDDVLKSLTAVFMEPYTTWGGSVASVKTYMSSYNLGGANTNDDDGSYVLWYYGKNREDEIDYYFDSPTGGLFLAYVFLNSEEVGEDELSSTFNEMGYTYVGSGDGFTTYKKSSDVYVEVGLNSHNFWYVAYYNPAMFARQYSSLRKPRDFALKHDISKKTSKRIYDRSYMLNKLQKCEKAISVKYSK